MRCLKYLLIIIFFLLSVQICVAQQLKKSTDIKFIDGFLYANIQITNLVVEIDSPGGIVVGNLYLSSIVEDVLTQKPNAVVVDVIAYDSADNKVYIIGKLCPSIVCVEF